MTGADIGIVLAYSAMIMIIFMLTWILVKPLKIFGKVIVNSILGVLLLLIFNYFDNFTGIHIGVNETTSLTMGILGIPGFAAMLAIKLFLM